MPKPNRLPNAPVETPPPPTNEFVLVSEHPWYDLTMRVGRKVAIWGSFFGTLWILSDFLSLIVITFIVCYILNSLAVNVMERFSLKRRVVVTGIFSVLAVLLVVGVLVIFPRAVEEGKRLYREMPATIQKAEKAATEFLENSLYERVQGLGIEQWVHDAVGVVAKKATAGVKDIFKFVFHLFLSLILAFLILFDLPKLARGVQRLPSSRLGPMYEEIAPHVVKFFEILGKVFEAQVLIATANTIITFFGLLFLNIPYSIVLSIVVFFGGFIPVLGVIISSTPIVLVGFNVGGFLLAFKVVALIALVHTLEAYVLNPQIMGEHLSIHPLVVIVVLLLGETFFGVWGLLLGVPVAIYVFRDILDASPVVEDAA